MWTETVNPLEETKTALYNDLALPTEYNSPRLDALVEAQSRYVKDLRLNIGNVLKSQSITKKEAYLLALATAVNDDNIVLEKQFTELSKTEGATDAEIAETLACVSLLSINNVFYRFRHFVGKDIYTQMPAGIKMTIMANPILGKEFFELMSLAISALNGCEMCVRSHEESVLHHGASQQRIFDAVRLVSVIRGANRIIR